MSDFLKQNCYTAARRFTTQMSLNQVEHQMFLASHRNRAALEFDQLSLSEGLDDARDTQEPIEDSTFGFSGAGQS